MPILGVFRYPLPERAPQNWVRGGKNPSPSQKNPPPSGQKPPKTSSRGGGTPPPQKPPKTGWGGGTPPPENRVWGGTPPPKNPRFWCRGAKTGPKPGFSDPQKVHKTRKNPPDLPSGGSKNPKNGQISTRFRPVFRPKNPPQLGGGYPPPKTPRTTPPGGGGTPPPKPWFWAQGGGCLYINASA
jgi:hypothetical protein